jgi:uncharacterized repeat protein (TIGR02543 family)
VFFARGNARCGGSVKLIRRPLQSAETVLWRISSGDDIGTTRTFVDPDGVTTVLFDQFDCDQATGSDAWVMGEDFSPQLSVKLSGDANGTVTSSPAGINCGNDCAESYASGTGVTLTAEPAPGASFAGWSGACTGTNKTCTLTMNGPRSVTASFTKKPLLTVEKNGTGNGIVTSIPAGINCGMNCESPYDQGTTVTLMAQPNGTSTFAGWGGACNGSGNCVVTMNGSRLVTATFTAAEQTLMVAIDPNGTGTGSVTSDTGGISCPGTCQAAYAPNTEVILSAHPGSGSDFTGWSGSGCNGTGNCTVTMDGAKSVTARFDLQVPVVLGPTLFDNPLGKLA